MREREQEETVASAGGTTHDQNCMSSPGNPLVGSKSQFCQLSWSVVLPLFVQTVTPLTECLNKLTFATHSSPNARTSGSTTAWYRHRDSFDLATQDNRQPKTTKRSSISIAKNSDWPQMRPQMVSLDSTSFFGSCRYGNIVNPGRCQFPP